MSFPGHLRNEGCEGNEGAVGHIRTGLQCLRQNTGEVNHFVCIEDFNSIRLLRGGGGTFVANKVIDQVQYSTDFISTPKGASQYYYH